MVASANYLVRFQSHYGSAQGCQSNLSTFGIPAKILPLTVDGEVHCHDHALFLSRLQKMNSEEHNYVGAYTNQYVVANEREQPSRNVNNLAPGPQDIIMGRGKRGSRYVGNGKLRDVIEERYSVYKEGLPASRKALAHWIYSQLIHYGARFLTYSEQEKVWYELDEELAIGKILHGFRNHGAKVNKQSRDILDALEYADL